MRVGAVLIFSGLMVALAAARPDAGLAQEAAAAPQTLPRIDEPLEKVEDLDAAMVDSDAITGAVMNEKDMLQYCVNIADDAREARYALIKRELAQAEADVDEKLASLDEKLKAVRDYVEIRNEFQAAAEDHVVSIFETMRADSAAQQLAALDMRLAAAIIMKLDPKISSNILGEMKPKAAARLASILTSAMMPQDGSVNGSGSSR